MNKDDAIRLLGGTVTAVAKAIGVTQSAVSQWPEAPDALPQRIVDRVQAAIARRHLPPELLGMAPAKKHNRPPAGIPERRKAKGPRRVSVRRASDAA
jgi:hypothetical protein